jgi:hypothetical protein
MDPKRRRGDVYRRDAYSAGKCTRRGITISCVFCWDVCSPSTANCGIILLSGTSKMSICRPAISIDHLLSHYPLTSTVPVLRYPRVCKSLGSTTLQNCNLCARPSRKRHLDANNLNNGPTNPKPLESARPTRQKTKENVTSNPQDREQRLGKSILATLLPTYSTGGLTFFTIRAGLPTTTLYSSTSFVTTLPAPTTQPFPIVTPANIVALPPIQQSSPIYFNINNRGGRIYTVIGKASSAPSRLRVMSIGWVAA